MSIPHARVFRKTWFPVTLVLLTLYSAVPKAAHAQISITGSNQGYNAVWSGTNTISGSAASIDASKFTGDICAKITAAISAAVSYGLTNGVVIDARGGGTLSCASSPTTNSVPATILLPAGTITLPGTWTLGNETRIIGVGRNQTTIKPSFSGSGAVIAMGSASTCPSSGCAGVVVSELWVQGASTGTSLTGIENGYSNQNSYIEHVTITNFNNNGLLIEGAVADNGTNTFLADGSGPYLDLIISSVNATAISCVKLQARTFGIHGLTCTSNGVTPVGIYLDGSENTIEDVHFEGVVDGILVGSQYVAVGNSIVNITGLNGSGTLSNDIHVSNAQTSGSPNVSDLTLIGISPYNLATSDTVKDDLTGINIPKSQNVAVYALGKSFGGGYTLFGTSPVASGTTPGLSTWGVGTTNVAGQSCNTPGAVYSNTSGASGSTVFVCVAAKTWQSIP